MHVASYSYHLVAAVGARQAAIYALVEAEASVVCRRRHKPISKITFFPSMSGWRNAAFFKLEGG